MAGTITDALRESALAVQNAQEVRAYHRKRTTRSDTQRNDDLRIALARVKAAMKPLRSEIGRYPKRKLHTPSEEEQHDKIKAASLALQKERRKLWKMLDRPERTT